GGNAPAVLPSPYIGHKQAQEGYEYRQPAKARYRSGMNVTSRFRRLGEPVTRSQTTNTPRQACRNSDTSQKTCKILRHIQKDARSPTWSQTRLILPIQSCSKYTLPLEPNGTKKFS